MPDVWRCEKGFWKVRCSCKWFVGMLFVDPGDALDRWEEHVSEVFPPHGR